ncbi:YcgL domain-containing protein [Luteimonas sp. TWI1437]|uniref:YcgL domain-containing protein n=1 Tax=unclassified Luteimonas TaxID=2629088 RepID=UPI003207CEC0
MHAYVYKSQRKADTYVYLATRDAFDVLPDSLRAELGALVFVLEVALTSERRLARENPAQVRGNLQSQGFHLQMPPRSVADPLTDDWSGDA